MRSIPSILASTLIAYHVSARSTISAFQTTTLISTKSRKRYYHQRQKDDAAFTAYRHTPLWANNFPSQPEPIAIGSINRLKMVFQSMNVTNALSNKVLVKRPTLIKSTAFLAGIADVCCFSRHNCYANMMTGNTIKCAMSASRLCLADTAFFAILILSYLIGFGAYRIADQTVTIGRFTSAPNISTAKGNIDEVVSIDAEKSRPPTTPAVIAPVVFGIFALYDMLWGSHFLSPSNKRWLVPILAVGSGMINSASAESTGVVTGMMSGNLQRMANYVADMMLHRIFNGSNNKNNSSYYPKPSKDRLKGFRTSAKILTSFIFGIVVASVGMRQNANLEALVTYGLGGFTTLGGAYAVLLFLYSCPEIEFSLHIPTKNKVQPPCELDLYETECLVDQEEYADEDDSVLPPVEQKVYI